MSVAIGDKNPEAGIHVLVIRQRLFRCAVPPSRLMLSRPTKHLFACSKGIEMRNSPSFVLPREIAKKFHVLLAQLAIRNQSKTHADDYTGS